jgi:hypothetical protein
MASPVVEASTGTTFTANASSWAVSLTGVVSGRLLVIAMGWDGGPTVDTPTGWTQVDFGGPGGHCRHCWYYKKSDGGEGSSVTINKTGGANQEAVAYMWSISGAEDPATQAPYTNGRTDDATAVTTFSPPTVTPGSTDDYLALVSVVTDDSEPVTGFPASYTGTGTHNSGGTAGVGQGWGSRQYTGNAENPGDFTTATSEEGSSATLVIVAGSAAATPTLVALIT